jgi:hypothetical protein
MPSVDKSANRWSLIPRNVRFETAGPRTSLLSAVSWGGFRQLRCGAHISNAHDRRC